MGVISCGKTRYHSPRKPLCRFPGAVCLLALRLWGTMWINLYNKARRNGMRKPALGFASKWGRHGARQRKWLAVCALWRRGGGFSVQGGANRRRNAA